MMPDDGNDTTAVWNALGEVMDPCMAAGGHRVSIVDLGLIRTVKCQGRCVEVEMTFTEVGCPFTHRVIDRMEQSIQSLGRFHHIIVKPVWKPGWVPERMNETARSALRNGQERMRLRLLGQGDGGVDTRQAST